VILNKHNSIKLILLYFHFFNNDGFIISNINIVIDDKIPTIVGKGILFTENGILNFLSIFGFCIRNSKTLTLTNKKRIKVVMLVIITEFSKFPIHKPNNEINVTNIIAFTGVFEVLSISDKLNGIFISRAIA